MLQKMVKSPLQYWQADGAAWLELQSICLRLFSLATSTASCERNFSAHAFVHSKLKNCLWNEKVEKLVYIRTNFNLFQDGPISSKGNCSSDEEAEDFEDWSIPNSPVTNLRDLEFRQSFDSVFLCTGNKRN